MIAQIWEHPFFLISFLLFQFIYWFISFFPLTSKVAPSVLFSGVWVEPMQMHKHQIMDIGTISEVEEKRGENKKKGKERKYERKSTPEFGQSLLPHFTFRLVDLTSRLIISGDRLLLRCSFIRHYGSASFSWITVLGEASCLVKRGITRQRTKVSFQQPVRNWSLLSRPCEWVTLDTDVQP